MGGNEEPSPYTPQEQLPAPEGFVHVPGATVTGRENYRIVYTNRTNNREAIQYGAFVPGRVTAIPSFYMAKYEVTYELWHEVCQWAVSEDRGDSRYVFVNAGKESNSAASGTPPSEKKSCPVTDISWRDAVVWCNAYSEKAGLEPVYYHAPEDGGGILRAATAMEGYLEPADKAVMRREKSGYRLPTMAEREYAARGGEPNLPDWRYKYSGSDNPDEVAWYYGTSGMGLGDNYAQRPDFGIHPVGTKKPNRLGIYDLSGNAEEWGWDWMRYNANAKNPPMGTPSMDKTLDPATPEEGPAYSSAANQKPMSGGSWWYGDEYCLVTIWWGYSTWYHDNSVGFRVVRGMDE
ncbi:MAG: formylglycine-generating enzyme family protein [Treponema sp.]|nr:formylglycine-generating enzyme family protein [Treponema sp.]